MLGAIRRLFGGGREAPAAAAADAVEYKGYQIIAQPQKAPGGFLTSGLIVLENDGGGASTASSAPTPIRAPTTPATSPCSRRSA